MFIHYYTKSEFIQHIVVLIFIISGSLYCNENEPDSSKGVVGIRGGISYANFTENDTDAYDPEFTRGVSLGGFLDAWINKYLSVQFEINYIEKGSEGFEEFVEFYDSESYGHSGLYFKEKAIFSYKLKYIEFPVLLKFHPIKVYNISPGIYCGLSAAVNIESRMKVRDGGISEALSVVESNEKIDDLIDDKEYNAVFGTSIDYEFNRFKVLFDFRYNLGLRNIFKNDDFDYKNSVIIFSVGFGYKPSPVKRSPEQISNRYL